MAALNVSLVGDRALMLRMQRMPSAIRDALARAVEILALRMEARVKQKLSGEVLGVVTGALRRSITHETTVGTTSVRGRVFSSGDVKYAAIHEFGGTIHIPDIYPTAAKALRFQVGGATVFAAHVAAHDVHMPERSYLRSTLTDMEGEIRQGLLAAAREGAQQR